MSVALRIPASELRQLKTGADQGVQLNFSENKSYTHTDTELKSFMCSLT